MNIKYNFETLLRFKYVGTIVDTLTPVLWMWKSMKYVTQNYLQTWI